MEQFCRDNGVDFFSAFDGIASAYRTNPSIYWDRGMHFTPLGQRLWADLFTGYYVAVDKSRNVLNSAAGASATR